MAADLASLRKEFPEYCSNHAFFVLCWDTLCCLLTFDSGHWVFSLIKLRPEDSQGDWNIFGNSEVWGRHGNSTTSLKRNERLQRWWFGISFGTQISGGYLWTWGKDPSLGRTFTGFCLWLLDNLQKEMAAEHRIPACRIPCTDKPRWAWSVGLKRLRHD